MSIEQGKAASAAAASRAHRRLAANGVGWDRISWRRLLDETKNHFQRAGNPGNTGNEEARDMAIPLSRNDVVGHAKELKNVPAFVPVLDILSHWLQICLGLAVLFVYQAWWLYVLVALFVAARQYGLAVLLHDAQHALLSPSKRVNQWVGVWLLAAPLGVQFEESQKSHLDHHAHFGSKAADPDYLLYCFGEPILKQTAWQVGALFVSRSLGGKILSMLKAPEIRVPKSHSVVIAGLHNENWSMRRLRSVFYRLRYVILMQSVLLATFTWLFGWYGYFLLWAAPLATVAVFLNDFRVFCEHSLIGRDAVNPDERLISFISNPVERWFFAPNHMNYHAEHHLFPYLPHTNLPALRELIRNCPELNDRIEWRASYFGHLRAYITGLNRFPGSGQARIIVTE